MTLPMLVVNRSPGEAIVIDLPAGELIEVVILKVDGTQIRLETNAPDQVLVLREELLEEPATRH